VRISTCSQPSSADMTSVDERSPLKYASVGRPLTRLKAQGLANTVCSLPFLGLVLFAFSAGFPPFDDATEVNLTLHMLQHVLIILSGFLVAYPLRDRGLFKGLRNRRAGLLSFGASAALLAFWHYPTAWDAAVLNPLVHAVEHLSFFGIGLLVGSAMSALGDGAKIGVILAAFFGHMLYAVFLIYPQEGRVYSLYPVSQQVTLGWVLIVTGPSLLVGVAWIMVKNPTWLLGATGMSGKRSDDAPALTKRPRNVITGTLSVGLMCVFVVYLIVAGAAVFAAPTHQGAVVYIVETPVSWNYSPRNITVVVGVNNSVIWISHSISYDTVTGQDGMFGSQPIPPGGTFSYTFDTAGVYQYHCVYHPWMVGFVTVLD